MVGGHERKAHGQESAVRGYGTSPCFDSDTLDGAKVRVAGYQREIVLLGVGGNPNARRKLPGIRVDSFATFLDRVHHLASVFGSYGSGEL